MNLSSTSYIPFPTSESSTQVLMISGTTHRLKLCYAESCLQSQNRPVFMGFIYHVLVPQIVKLKSYALLQTQEATGSKQQALKPPSFQFSPTLQSPGLESQCTYECIVRKHLPLRNWFLKGTGIFKYIT